MTMSKSAFYLSAEDRHCTIGKHFAFERVMLKSIWKWDFCWLTIKGAIRMSEKSGGLGGGVYLVFVGTYSSWKVRVTTYSYEGTLFQPCSQALSILPPFVVGRKTRVAAGHVTTKNLAGKNICWAWGVALIKSEVWSLTFAKDLLCSLLSAGLKLKFWKTREVITITIIMKIIRLLIVILIMIIE